MALIELKVNGQVRTVDADPECPLLIVLREKLHVDAGFSCRVGTCGTCTILLDNVPTRICLLPVSEAIGKTIDTGESKWEWAELPKEFGNW
jgi:aerobic-type carbon monoxide dehydrogenase small subunit (CoxS/CutS family)